MTNAKYVKLTAGLLVAWFIFSLSASALHGFKNDSARLGLSVGLAALIPIRLCMVLRTIPPAWACP
jgi:hypothetical protein